MWRRLRQWGMFGVLITAAAVTVGCGGTHAANDRDQTVAVRSALGTAHVPVHPKRVVTIGWGSQDAALALGVVPVGMPDFSSDSGTKDGILPWDKPLLKGKKPALLNTTSGHVPFEDIAKLHPDVILAVDSGLDKQQYAQLSNVAPTVAYPGKAWATSWQDQLSLVGKALGRSDKAEELRRTTEARIAKAAASHPEFRGKTVVFGSQLKAGTFNLYHADDARLKLLAALGFTVDPFVQNLAHTDGSTTFSTAISAEQLSSIKANVLIAWYPTTAVQRTAENQPGFAQLPAVRNKAYIPYTDPPFVFATSTANVLSLPWMLDRYLPKLSEAAKNARPAG